MRKRPLHDGVGYDVNLRANGVGEMSDTGLEVGDLIAEVGSSFRRQIQDNRVAFLRHGDQIRLPLRSVFHHSLLPGSRQWNSLFDIF